MLPVIRRFFSFGEATSRYTCARVSNPLIARRECPKATMIITKEICDQKVPLSQPSDSLVKCRFLGVGAGGNCTWPRSNSVTGAHINRITSITVVICIIRSAFVLDSGTPLMLLHQKYTVTTMLKNTENHAGSVRHVWCRASLRSLSRRPR